MNFDGDAFISYSPLDNVALKEGGKGWIANLHRALEARVGQLLGKQPAIWRDPKLSGNDSVEDAQYERLRHVAALVSVVSPAYVKSDSAKRELVEFWKAAEAQGGVRLGDKDRVFKVLKTPVPREKEALELQSLHPYEFFKLDPETGRVRELDEIFGPTAQTDFWFKLDDLAHDICSVLEILENPQPTFRSAPVAETQAIYLAETTSDLREKRDAIKRDLLQHGYVVLPSRTLPLVVSSVGAAVRADLARCRMSIHLVGKSYGLVPEGADLSLLEIQNELAIERGKNGGFSRLLWIPMGLRVEDERQRMVIEQLRMDPRMQAGADLLETSLEDLRTEIMNRLKVSKEPSPSVDGNVAKIYLMYDQRDTEAITPWADFLFEQGLEVIRPMLGGDEAEIREFHEDNLRSCDGALIFYGAANECWLRRKLAELRKSAGYGRVGPMPEVAIVLIPPKSTEKEWLKTHEAGIIRQWEGLSPDSMGPFVSGCLRHHNEPRSVLIDDEETLPAKPPRVEIGTKIGRYEIIAPLGVGGMGEVYRARDHKLDCDVAIKIIRAGLLANEGTRSRFRKEAMALARLRNSQRIAVIYDVGQQAGMDYIVMECVPGETLAEKLRSGSLRENEVVSIGVQIAEALEEAHLQSIVHRDLKPANIKVTTKDQVKVLDFGLAKFVVATTSFPETQSPIGTVSYMSPEQLRGESVDARTDLYALGNVLFEMAAGRKPFQEDSMGRLIDAILHQPPTHLRALNPRLSADLDRIVAKTLEKDRELRYQSAADLRADLTMLMRNAPMANPSNSASLRKDPDSTL